MNGYISTHRGRYRQFSTPNVLQQLKPVDSLMVADYLLNDNSLLNNRKDIQAYEKATMAFEKLYKADKMSFMPRLNLFGSYELYDDEIFKGDGQR